MVGALWYNGPMKAAVEIAGLSMAYGDRVLFSGISATLRSGTCTVVAGPNGAGKSTILRIVCGLQRPTAGAVKFRLDDNREEDPRNFRRRMLGYAGPDFSPYTELSGAENILFAARIRGMKLGSPKDLLKRVGLKASRMDEPVGTYSSGMKQRVRLAMSILGDPPLLVWDEPTAMLDSAGRCVVETVLNDHLSRGGTLLIATNDAAEVDRWAHQKIEFARE